MDNQGRELWDEFVKKVANGDSDIEWYLQMVIGSALIGKVYHEGLIMAYGGGRNCKSTFFNACLSALGDYAGTIDVKVLTTDRQNRGASLASLRGKRLVVAGELEEHQRLSVSTLKQICSTDRITIEEKFKQPETVIPSHTLVMFTNFLPRVGSTDGGTWRRLNVVPFKAQIPPGEGIQNYADVLVEKAGGAILHWAIEGAMGFAYNGYHLAIPDSVAEATAEYKERENWIGNFIEARCVKDPNARTPAAALYATYAEWARGTGDYVRPERTFKEVLMAQGFESKRTKQGFMWYGLDLQSVASHYKLDNLVVIVDHNGLQIDGRVSDVMNPCPIGEKFAAFGFHVEEVNGNDFCELEKAFNAAREIKGVPTAIVMKTLKGRGVSFMEDKAAWHGKAPNDAEYEIAMGELKAALAELEGM